MTGESMDAAAPSESADEPLHGGFERPSAESKRISASTRSLAATVSAVLVDPSGPLRKNVWKELPTSDLIRRIWSCSRDLCGIHGVSEEVMTNVAPNIRRNRAFRANAEGASGQSDVEVLPAHDAQIISFHKAQHNLGQQVDRVRYQRYVGTLNQLPETAGQPGPNDMFGGNQSQRSCQRSATEYTGARCCRLFESKACESSTNPTGFGVRIYGMTLPGNGGTPSGEVPLLRSDGVNTRHTRRKTKPLVHALRRTFKRFSIRHEMESGTPLNDDRNPPVGMFIERPPRRFVRRQSSATSR